MPEKIRCAAIRFEPCLEFLSADDKSNVINSKLIVKDMSHSGCMTYATERYGRAWLARDEYKDEQGFVTTTGRFVDRSEALEIAKKNNQLKYKIPEYKTWLDSYEVNFVIE
jgi:hypothetical protein